MHGTTGTVNSTLPDVSRPADERSRRADFVYQTVTVAAILLVLGSIWVF
jgi:hypothetical protein